jgi:polysaccharide export outer membrane protein
MYRYLSQNIVVSVLVLALLGLSCTPQKEAHYFETVPYNSEVQTLITKDFEHKIKVDDILLIAFFSSSVEIAKYNASADGYLVDKNGNIQVYNIGDVKVVGLTVDQVKQKLMKILMPDIFKTLTISARFKNHRVIVLGEVGSPGVIPMETEHLSLLEAISMRGDLREDARKDNLLVIRNTDRGKMFYRVNLLNSSVFNSDYYYLQADDILYVEAEPKKKSGQTDRIIGYVISGLSLLLLIGDRINR